MSDIKLFYSYSTKDEKLRDELENSLSMLKRYNSIAGWHFRKILPGAELNKEIDSELESADIILLLVSPDFLASSYCYDIEVKKALEYHKNGKAHVIPVILRTCDWLHEKSPIKDLEAIPKDGNPVTLWTDRDQAFNDITQSIKKVIKVIEEKKKSTGEK